MLRNSAGLVKKALTADAKVGMIVDAEITLESRRCKTIIDKNFGKVFNRPDDPRARWEQLYERALHNPDDFEVVMEDKPETVMEVEGDQGMETRPLFDAAELESMSMPRLREIGNMYNVKSNAKSDIILKILNAQAHLVKRAQLENLPSAKA